MSAQTVKLFASALKIAEEHGLPFKAALEVAEAREQGETEARKAELIDHAAPIGEPNSESPPEYRPRIGWQIALFDAWSAICKLYGRPPTAAEAVRYLQAKDQSGVILPKTDGGSLWWNRQRGQAKEITLKTVENTISNWRTRGVLPA